MFHTLPQKYSRAYPIRAMPKVAYYTVLKHDYFNIYYTSGRGNQPLLITSSILEHLRLRLCVPKTSKVNSYLQYILSKI